MKCLLDAMPIYLRAHEKHPLIIKFKVNFSENGVLPLIKPSLLDKLQPEWEGAEKADEID